MKPQLCGSHRGIMLLSGVLFLTAYMQLLTACMQRGQPLIAERSPVLDQRTQRTYIVRAGDTLYSIAWRYELDYLGLARANSISSPYVIRTGQKLRLTTQLPASRRIRAPASKPQQTPEKLSLRKSQLAWMWPLDVEPVVEYGGNSKGMDFRLGAASASARAAASGEVVYAGSGIGGYERLVIIKHDQSLLSAYGFDGQLTVREQQQVKSGAELARIRRRGGTQFALHFELRRNGQPIDPRTHLK